MGNEGTIATRRSREPIVLKPVPRSPWITLHRYLGLVAIPLLLLAAVTGCVLSFMRPIDAWINADLFAQPLAAAAGKPAPDVAPLVDRFAARHPEWVVRGFPLAVAETRRIVVDVDRAAGLSGPPVDQVFLDRFSAEPAGTRFSKAAWNKRGAMELVLELHAHLLAGTWGRWIMGTVAVLWLIGHGVGFYLTFPLKRPFWKGWKRSWKVSFRSMFAKFMLDWHKASALWLFVPLTALALTSVALNFFEEAYAPMIEAAFGDDDHVAPAGEPKDAPLDFAGAVAAARAHAVREGIDWQPASVLANPDEGTIGVTMTDDGTVNYHRLGPIYYYFDRASHAVVETYDPYHGNRSLAGYRLLYPLHSGRVGGNVTILLIFLSGLATAGLCVTGVYVWWKKRKSRVAARRAAALRRG